MRKVIVMFCLMMLLCLTSFANNNPNSVYKMYPTDNIWTFLKLNTTNGKVWQVHFAVDNKSDAVEIPLISKSLTDNPSKDKFEIYKTSNMYNFLLMDTVDGRVWQIQWSFKENNRGIVRKIN